MINKKKYIEPQINQIIIIIISKIILIKNLNKKLNGKKTLDSLSNSMIILKKEYLYQYQKKKTHIIL